MDKHQYFMFLIICSAIYQLKYIKEHVAVIMSIFCVMAAMLPFFIDFLKGSF